MENPIKDNRIVRDITFALRLLSFAMDTDVSCAAGEDEKESMISYSSKLLEYQIKTATEQSEINYLKRCNAKQRLKGAKKFLSV